MAVMLQPAAAGLPMLTPELAAKYAPELVGVALIVIYLLNAYFGAQKNKEIATNWIRCKRVIRQGVTTSNSSSTVAAAAVTPAAPLLHTSGT